MALRPVHTVCQLQDASGVGTVRNGVRWLELLHLPETGRPTQRKSRMGSCRNEKSGMPCTEAHHADLLLCYESNASILVGDTTRLLGFSHLRRLAVCDVMQPAVPFRRDCGGVVSPGLGVLDPSVTACVRERHVRAIALCNFTTNQHQGRA